MSQSASSFQHILVVNDTEEILDLFRDIVEGLGHSNYRLQLLYRKRSGQGRGVRAGPRDS